MTNPSDPMPILVPTASEAVPEEEQPLPRREPHPNACPECGHVSPVPEQVRTGFCPACMTHTNPNAPEAPEEKSFEELMQEAEANRRDDD